MHVSRKPFKSKFSSRSIWQGCHPLTPQNFIEVKLIPLLTAFLLLPHLPCHFQSLASILMFLAKGISKKRSPLQECWLFYPFSTCEKPVNLFFVLGHYFVFVLFVFQCCIQIFNFYYFSPFHFYTWHTQIKYVLNKNCVLWITSKINL